ncbi:hypothetical protein [Pseudoalteromonas umbrosa]|uniref:hypothetical protein n=1 Tax=Pseudoalteromonas umbrosa TaxID=3048489 RepID=UPI0024C3F6CD|nr:hypothetical protein [Pseudoalteromonas sp. B95]MDK1285919.1 hypothetical protein [Pseudoalteromonas sp. B95]
MQIQQESFTGVFTRLLSASNWLLVASIVGFGLAIIASYPLSHLLSIPVQISAHIGSLLFATLLKISYVVRCLCQYSLGLEVR